MVLTDINNNVISVGDIVIFTEPGAGRNLPGLKRGEVIGLTKAGVRIKYLDNLGRRTMREEWAPDLNRPWFVRANGEQVYHSEKTGGWVENEPENIRYYPDRFLIVGRV